jgi:hypothetical protein
MSGWPWWTADDQRFRPEKYRAGRAALFEHNRAIEAERDRWPAGVLEECVHLESEHPDWRVAWVRVSGFTARREGRHEVEIVGPNTDVVGQAMTQAPPEHTYYGACWCTGQDDVPRVIRIRLDAPAEGAP